MIVYVAHYPLLVSDRLRVIARACACVRVRARECAWFLARKCARGGHRALDSLASRSAIEEGDLPLALLDPKILSRSSLHHLI